MPDMTNPATWYSIRRLTPAASAARGVQSAAEIFIYGDIGESWYEETVSARQFVQDLAAIDADAITVRINSIGGSVPDGIAIRAAMLRHKAQITTVVDGMALSVASLIFMGGDVREMGESSVLMVHAPWTYAAGNAAQLREMADQLDTWAAAMSSSYATEGGLTQAQALALLSDGKDHYYTAAEAMAAGLATGVVAAMPVAASARFDLSRYRDLPPAAAVFGVAPLVQPPAPVPTATPAAPAANTTEPTMTTTVTPPAAGQPTAPAAPDAAAILAADKSRREGVRAKLAPWAGRMDAAEHAALLRMCEDDLQCTPEAAATRLLDVLGKNSAPAQGRISTVQDEGDKRIEAAAAALMVRAGVATDEQRKHIQANPFRGMRLTEIARASLERAGVRTQGMDQMSMVAAAFTQSTSDFPILLENTMNKTLRAAYATAPDTWSRFCARGTVSDFRVHNRYRVGSLGNLDTLTELGEFRNRTIPDGEKGVISAATRGNIINLSRQAVVNDDLGAFVGLAAMLGRAARRTIEADVYALLALNSGAGPTMLDGQPLFHASHNNISTGAALSMLAVDADRVLMASQRDVSGVEFLDLRPAVLVVPLSLGGTARTINDAQYDPDTANRLQRPNMVRGLFSDVVDTPRLTGTRRYVFASPSDAPALEVAFLDGNEEPFLELENGFTVDGARWKARLDYGVAATDWRGAVTNAGA